MATREVSRESSATLVWRACAGTIVGAVATLGVVSLGWLLLAPALAALAWLLRQAPRWPVAMGTLLGSGVMCLGISWLQASGLRAPWVRAALLFWIVGVLIAGTRVLLSRTAERPSG